jgi:hypothetical protein
MLDPSIQVVKRHLDLVSTRNLPHPYPQQVVLHYSGEVEVWGASERKLVRALLPYSEDKEEFLRNLRALRTLLDSLEFEARLGPKDQKLVPTNWVRGEPWLTR